MAGDPVIRWQTMRDLLEVSEPEWQAEREATISIGWGAKFLESLRSDGTWPDGRWTGTVWTLLTIIDCGLPPTSPKLCGAGSAFLDRMLTQERCADPQWLLKSMDLCHVGFWLRIGSYFTPADERLLGLANTILSVQMQDGGWNCRIRTYPKTHHGSFHTTFNVLDGLRESCAAGIISRDTFAAVEIRAMDFMLAHQMYRSDKTGEVVSDRFLHLTYPSHWHYTVLRGLDYMRSTEAITDKRLDDPIDQLISRRNKAGRWPVEKRIPGATLFEMEKLGGESRWNTLRALMVLKNR
jgi:hypothetical protein